MARMSDRTCTCGHKSFFHESYRDCKGRRHRGRCRVKDCPCGHFRALPRKPIFDPRGV